MEVTFSPSEMVMWTHLPSKLPGQDFPVKISQEFCRGGWWWWWVTCSIFCLVVVIISYINEPQSTISEHNPPFFWGGGECDFFILNVQKGKKNIMHCSSALSRADTLLGGTFLSQWFTGFTFRWDTFDRFRNLKKPTTWYKTPINNGINYLHLSLNWWVGLISELSTVCYFPGINDLPYLQTKRRHLGEPRLFHLFKAAHRSWPW